MSSESSHSQLSAATIPTVKNLRRPHEDGRFSRVRCGVVQPRVRNLSACPARFPIRKSGPGQSGRSGRPVLAIAASLCLNPRVRACAGARGSASRPLAEHGVPVRLPAIEGVFCMKQAPRANRNGKSVRPRLQPSCRASSCFLRCPEITLTCRDLASDTDLVALSGRRSISIVRPVPVPGARDVPQPDIRRQSVQCCDKSLRQGFQTPFASVLAGPCPLSALLPWHPV